MNTILLHDSVPHFIAIATNTQSLQLQDYVGKNVLLYFYPKDNTSGCTQQAQDFRDYNAQFNALNTIILGVSRDSLRSHQNFKAKQALPFDLISDGDESLCQLFDVMKLKNMYGKQVRGIERSTFLINDKGVLIHEWRKVKVPNHCLAVLDFLKAMSVSNNTQKA